MKEMIDVVIPYVNNNDRVWQKTYINYCVDRGYINKITAMRGNRYDDNNMFEYLIRGIEKFMPFVNRVFLLVSNIEQVPAFIKRHKKVKVVLHREFIYSQYLPTFNSTTIEMFYGILKTWVKSLSISMMICSLLVCYKKVIFIPKTIKLE